MNRERNLIMLEGSSHKEGIKMLNMYIPSSKTNKVNSERVMEEIHKIIKLC